jgi:D-alanyl-D-alanine carboxypeptidase
METNSEPKKGISKWLLAFNALSIFLIIFMVFTIDNILKKREVKKESENEALVYESQIPSPFEKVTILGKAAYVFDVTKNRILYKKNEFEQLPLASLTKLMTALTAYDLMPSDSEVTIKKEFLSEDGDNGLLANESWKLKDLLDFSLVVSSNDGARSIASVVGAANLKTNDYDLGRKDFISKMNQKAQELGLKQMYFTNETGLDQDYVSGGYGSALDVEKLFQYIIQNKPEVISATKFSDIKIESMDNKSHKAQNTNVDVNTIPGLIGSKTGYTALAGGNLAVAFDPSIGRPIIVVVLGSTPDGRFKDVEALVKASLEYVKE